MTKRLIITAITFYEDRDGNERKKFTPCGTAFVNQIQDGQEVTNLKFDFMPTAAPGQRLEIALFPPKAKDDNAGGGAN